MKLRSVLVFSLVVLFAGTLAFGWLWSKKDAEPLPVPFTKCSMQWDSGASGLIQAEFKSPGTAIPPKEIFMLTDGVGWKFKRVSPAGSMEVWYTVEAVKP